MGVHFTKVLLGNKRQENYPWKELEQQQTLAYYEERGRASTKFVGAADKLGYTGEVTQEAASSMFAGLAADGEKVISTARRYGAFDFTFNAPKGVSVLYETGSSEVKDLIDDAWDRSIDRALAYFEEHVLAVRIGSGRNEAERRVVAASNVMGVRYDHRFSRADTPQPHKHSHVMIANLAQGPDGKWRGIHTMDMFVNSQMLGAMQEAFLREELSRTAPGIEWEPVINGTADIAQVPKELREEFSARRREIVEKLEELRADGVKANARLRNKIAEQSRSDKKFIEDMDAWAANVRKVSASFGLDEARIELGILYGPEPKPKQVARASELIEQLVSPTGLTEKKNTFLRAELVLAAVNAGVAASDIDSYVEQLLSDKRVIEIPSNKGVRYTDQGLVDMEQLIIDIATEGLGAVPQFALDENVAVKVAAEFKAAQTPSENGDHGLNPQQLAVLMDSTTNENLISVYEARAGVGKTTVAQCIREAYERAGVRVIGAAPTGRAATELGAKSGIEVARTIDKWLVEISNGKTTLSEGQATVLVLDEAGMAHTRQTAALFEQARAEGVKVIVFGDSRQLASVQAGGWLGAIGRLEAVPALEMTKNVRQYLKVDQDALYQLCEGRPQEWISLQTERGNITEFATKDARLAADAAVKDLLETAQRRGTYTDVLIATPTRVQRTLINELTQQARLEAGQLGGRIALPNVEKQLHVGDRVMLTRNDYGHDVSNGMRGEIRGVNERGELVVAIDDIGSQIRHLPAGYVADHVELGYAATVHKWQGATVEEAIVVGEPQSFNRQLGYTAFTRAKASTRLILIGDDEPDRTRMQQFADRLRRSNDEELAIEELAAAAEQTAIPDLAAAEPDPVELTEAAIDVRGERRFVSPYRTKLADLKQSIRHVIAFHEQLLRKADANDLERAEIDTKVQALKDAALRDRKATPRRKRHELQVRDAARQEAIGKLEAARAQIPAPIDREHVNETYGKQRRKFIGEQIDTITLAAQDEIEMRAPVFERTLGPRPENDALTQRAWDRAALNIAEHRVRDGITDPTDHGIDPTNPRHRGNASDVQRSIDKLNKLWAEQGADIDIPALLQRSADLGIGM